MFYFAHPFGGIATPSSTSYSINPYAGVPTAECRTSHSKCSHRQKTTPNRAHQQQHLNDFTPWPRQTWQSRDVLSPLIQALQRQIGKFCMYILHAFVCVFNLKCNQTPLNIAGKIMSNMACFQRYMNFVIHSFDLCSWSTPKNWKFIRTKMR